MLKNSFSTTIAKVNVQQLNFSFDWYRVDNKKVFHKSEGKMQKKKMNLTLQRAIGRPKKNCPIKVKKKCTKNEDDLVES